MKLVFLEEFGKAFIPKRFRPIIRSHFLKAGITSVPFTIFGGLFYLSVIITGLIYISVVYPALVAQQASFLVFLITTFIYWVAIQLGIIVLLFTGIYTYIDQIIYSRTKKIESVLQDFLRYVSENLKGGMSFERAMWDAIRPKFGVLAHEIRLAAKKVMTGQEVDQALLEFTNKYESPMLKRTFHLLIEGMKGGHELADLIDKIENNLRETRELKQEISATNTTYVIFLTAISLVIAPALFGLSYNLLIILKNLSIKIGAAAGTNPNIPFNIGNVSLDPQIYKSFSIYAISITGAFSAMIISIIRKGNVKSGLKYIPIYVVTAVVMYIIFRTILLLMFGDTTF